MTFYFQALHLLGLLLWIGPSLGGYFLLLAARRTGNPDFVRWLRLRWQTILGIEHAGLAIVLLAGLGRAWTLGWLANPPLWLVLKLLLVGLVVIPIELVDIWAAVRVRDALARDPGTLDRRLQLQDRLTDWSAVPLALTLVVIVYLVVWKPWW